MARPSFRETPVAIQLDEHLRTEGHFGQAEVSVFARKGLQEITLAWQCLPGTETVAKDSEDL